MSVFQAPATYPVSDRPVRIGGTHKPPYRIINNNTDGTVWLSDDPGITVGQGTPLHAGTSLQWAKPGALWAISNTDVNIIVTNEVDDWQPDPAAIAAAIINSGVIIIDRPETLLELSDDQSNLASFGPYDVSRYNSLILKISQTGSGTNFRRFFSLVFTNEILAVDPAISPSQSGIIDVQQWGSSENLARDAQIKVPITGKYVYFISQDLGAGTPAGMDITLIASSRVIPNVQYGVAPSPVISAQQQLGNLFSVVQSGIGTGDNNMGQTAIYRGPCIAFGLVVFTAAPGDSLIIIEDNQQEIRQFIGLNRAATPPDPGIIATGTNNVIVRAKISLWGNAVRVTFRNSSGAGGAVFYLTIVPDGPSY